MESCNGSNGDNDSDDSEKVEKERRRGWKRRDTIQTSPSHRGAAEQALGVLVAGHIESERNEKRK